VKKAHLANRKGPTTSNPFPCASGHQKISRGPAVIKEPAELEGNNKIY